MPFSLQQQQRKPRKQNIQKENAHILISVVVLFVLREKGEEISLIWRKMCIFLIFSSDFVAVSFDLFFRILFNRCSISLSSPMFQLAALYPLHTSVSICFVLFCFGLLRFDVEHMFFMIYKAVKHSIVKDWTLFSLTHIWIKYFDGANHRQISTVHIENTNQSIFSGSNQINTQTHSRNVYMTGKLIVSHNDLIHFSLYLFVKLAATYTIEWNSNYSDKHIKFCVKHILNIYARNIKRYPSKIAFNLYEHFHCRCLFCLYDIALSHHPQAIYESIKSHFIRNYEFLFFVFYFQNTMLFDLI